MLEVIKYFYCIILVGDDMCGPYDNEYFESYVKEKIIQDCLVFVGIIQKIKPMRYKKYATLDARLKSFEKCLISLKQDINTCCEAGFFYTGKIITLLYYNMVDLSY